jgi:cytochrome c-type biogenesis protein CcmE
MGSRLGLVLVIFFFAATLIVSVFLRDSDCRVFYTLQRYRVEQRRLQQELWQKQLRVEGLISPASISHHRGKQ